ncbi:hypothetical protein SAMN02745121_05448 [Nannocystis exedens]|uniref:DUF5678 domain-containing protein n=1 Tax=Nannocystis exedens TaxID=54 RepID=A0A1I2D849_9BACT|nr:hypothetical protein [Nannocystis exedens]PCC70667.1 hypothetical protein NAEX_03731 [Nannocystis exedens]SFE76727.1 hypothetical protein SAMN02745121_05448 [Nannocystis exedens]
MQPHPHSPPRSSEAWAAPAAKPKKKRVKKPVAKKKPIAGKKAGKKTSVKKQAKTAAKKKPLKGSVSSVSVADLVARLLGDEAARQVLASLAFDRSGNDKLAETPEIAELRRELDDSRRKLAALEQKLTELSNLVAGLTAARSAPVVGAGEEVEEDPCLRWLGDPSIEQYIGQHVALHATRGVIAHGDSLPPVLESVRAQGVSLDDVCLATVPALPF